MRRHAQNGPVRVICGGVGPPLLALFLAACGDPSSSPPLPSARVVASPEPERTPDGKLSVELPRINLSEPRPLGAVWNELVERRAQIDVMLAEERLLDLGRVARRMLYLLDELLAGATGLDKGTRIELGRTAPFVRDEIVAVEELATALTPGLLPFRLWQMDSAMVAMEELLPEALRDETRYPRPSADPPV